MIPSFFVDDIEAFVKEHGVVLSYPVLHLGERPFVGEINDPDGNPVRLWMKKDL